MTPKPRVTDLCFLDTNILLYSISKAPADVDKREVARSILLGRSRALSIQVCQEFYNQATHKHGRYGLPSEETRQLIHGFRRFPIQDTTFAILDAALALSAQTHYSIWDCLIVAAAQAQGCTILYTEDMQHGRIIDGLRIINPFREGALVG